MRNADVVRARARGLGWDAIATRFELSERQCRRILGDYRASRPRLHEIDPIEAIEQALECYDGAIEELALLAERTKHDAVRLGAIKSRLDALGSKLSLMSATGLMPDFHHLRVEVDVQRVVDTVARVLSVHAVPRDTQMAIAQTLRLPNGVPSEPIETGSIG